MGRVFIEDQGAVIFPGEKYGLHNRVFLTAEGNPTYEAKELGLTEKERALFPYDDAIHVVDVQQSGFFEVVIKAIELIDSSMVGKKKHLPYGFVTLTTGKMSSRLGNIISAETLIDQVKEELKKLVEGSHLPSKQEVLDQVAIGAIKFSYLKYAHQSDIKFDIKSSISLEGDSGPYVQYTFARTQSLLDKSGETTPHIPHPTPSLEPEERQVLQQLEYFNLHVEHATKNLSPSTLTEYLIDLSRAFNLFYQKYPILKSEKEAFRLALTQKVSDTLALGLYLLGIHAPKRM